MNYYEHVNNINENGFTIIKNGVENNLIDRVVCDFDNWVNNTNNNFNKGQHDRVTNFHIYSKNTLDLVTNKHVNEILKIHFNKEQVIYSSLFFREGTSQHYHRDTPHFYTNPIDKYCGIWYSLEDISIDAGPLKYFIGSHKLDDPNGHDVYNSVCKLKNLETIEIGKDFDCIIKYNKEIEDLCISKKLIEVNEKNYLYKVKKGDIIIWHPRLLHGGSNINNSTLTRYSMVTHNVPDNTYVFNAKHFFSKNPTSEYINNNLKFDYLLHNNIKIVDHKTPPKVQKNYA
jgi:ectoine hydroxylase-related dioxygenase (phytanoyl-CoA dioxygenase family)